MNSDNILADAPSGAGKRDRISLRPDPASWGDDELMSLAEAARLFWPDGPLTLASLRTAVRDGEWLQISLNKLGADPQLETDGVVGPATRNAVRAFQLSQDLSPDGVAGPLTIAAIEAALTRGKPISTIPVPPEIVLPPPGSLLFGVFTP